jgi:hypothetical protein
MEGEQLFECRRGDNLTSPTPFEITARQPNLAA